MAAQDKASRKARKSALTRELNVIKKCVAEDKTDDVMKRIKDIETKFEEFEKAHMKYHEGIKDDEDEEDRSEQYFADVLNNYVESMTYIRNWLKQCDVKPAEVLISKSMERTPEEAHVITMLNLPKVEIETFDGNPMRFHSFFSVFDEHVERTTLDPGAKLNRLLQYTSGKAKEAIRACVVIGGAAGYKEALGILKRRFGDDHLVSDYIIKSLRNGKPIRSPEDLQLFADELTNAVATLKNMEKLSEVDTQTSIVEMVNRLQPFRRNRWKKIALESKRQKKQYPGFEELVNFIILEADEATDPVYGQMGSSSKSASSGVKSTVSFNTAVSSTQKDVKKVFSCKVCGESHKIFACPVFKAMKVPDRIKFVKDNKMCENCLYTNHVVSECRRTTICSVPGCGLKHTKFLHQQPGTFSGNVNVKENASCNNMSQVCCVPTVPVLVNDREEVTSLLDTGSTASFCTKNLADKLGLVGTTVKYKLSTVNEFDKCKEAQIVNLDLKSIDGIESLKVRNVYVIDKIPAKVPNIDVHKFPHLKDLHFDYKHNHVDLLLGQDHAEALVPLQTRKGQAGEPFAVRTKFGWSLNGPAVVSGLVSKNVASNFIVTDIEEKVHQLWQIENDGYTDEITFSQNDKRVIDLWDKEIKVQDGHYVLPIPWKDNVTVPNNMVVAMSRLNSLRRSLMKRGIMNKYIAEIDKLLDKGFAEKVPDTHLTKTTGVWYLPHQAVISDKKPGKLRVVFDCASKYLGESLNDKCLQGPDLNNKLFHVLLRFRRHSLAFMADIEAMYYQVRVPLDDREYLRFLWVDSDGKVVQYRMTSHVFGGVWCAAVATYALRRTLYDFTADDMISDTILKSFYVDDCLQSLENIDQARFVMDGVCQVLACRGFRLTKFLANNEDLLSYVPESDRALQVIEFLQGAEGKALGVKWNPNSDCMYVDVNVEASKNVTRRDMLSTVASQFDPLGLISPVVVVGKILFQQATKLKCSWDSTVPDHVVNEWLKWLESLVKLKSLYVPRCLKPSAFDDAFLELHHFSDASEKALGCCSYLRSVNKDGMINVSLVCSRSKVAPIKTLSIPRLELQAAVLAARMDVVLQRELGLDITSSTFWVDSQIVLQYIKSEHLRFQVFVGNRVGEIRRLTSPVQWFHVPGEINPADMITRGQSPEQLMSSDWVNGPEFLRTHKCDWKVSGPSPVDPGSLEVKGDVSCGDVIVLEVHVNKHPLDVLIDHYSKWYQLKRATAWLKRFMQVLKCKCQGKGQVPSGPLSVTEIKQAEVSIVTHVQGCHYGEEVGKLVSGVPVSKSGGLRDLSPFINEDGVLCVGGRIVHAPISSSNKHPYIVPGSHPIATMIVREIHEIAHLGVEWCLSLLRSRYWVTKARVIIKKVKASCVTCRKLYAKPCVQLMSDLPPQRLTPDLPPFTFTGVDCFGPFMVKFRRSHVKRYGCIFTCLTTRAVHLEKLDSLDTDSFLNGLRRFIARRGACLKMWSDNGTNFVGGYSELSKALKELNQTQIQSYCTGQGIEWHFNPPHASHMGGIWERLIRVVKRVFPAILRNTSLNDEILVTVFAEAENIINSRPLTKVSDQVDDAEPLTPNHLLLLRGGAKPPAGVFNSDHVYRERWKHVQHLANQFWKRWLKEYVPELMKRNKWHHKQTNVKVGDLVLLMEENTPRGIWPLGLVTEVIVGRDKLVRSVRIKTKTTTLVRPITKVVMIEEC